MKKLNNKKQLQFATLNALHVRSLDHLATAPA
jgi:hypothetical protein